MKTNLALLALICLPWMANAQLSGTYTVGGTTPNYPTLDSAVNHLEAVGVSGAVTFNIRQGTYSTQVQLDSVQGTSSSNTVTFKSDPANTSDVWIQYSASSSSANFVWKFNGSDHIRLLNLKFRSLGTSYSRNIEFGLLTDDIVIDSCTFYNGYSGTSSSNYYANIYHGTAATDWATNCVVKNSHFIRGSMAVYLYGSSSSIRETGNKILNNRVDSSGYYGFYVYYQDSVKLIGNRVYGNSGHTSTQYGIMSYGNYYGSEYSGNEIVLENTSTCYGIYLSSYSKGTATHPIRCFNNMISILGTGTSTQRGITASISATTTSMGEYIEVYYNSVRLAGTSTSNGSNAFYVIGGDNIHVRNNSFTHFGTGNAFYIGTAPTNSTSDYNNLYSAGSNVAYLTSSNVANLSAWTAASTLDSHSVSADPIYTSNVDLHVSSPSLDSAATPISYIAADFDGQARNATHPDIGADEFTPPACIQPSGVTATIISSDSAVINWTTGGASTWNLEWDTVGFTRGTGNIFKNLSSTTFSIGGLSLGGVYEVYIQDSCGGGNGSSAWSKVTVTIGYCTSFATNSGDTKIDSVFIAGKTFGSSPSSCETYTAHVAASDVIQMNRSNSYSLTVLNGYCASTHYSAYVKAWIDFDGNLQYNDSNELVLVMSSTTTALHNIITSNVSIPTSAVLGKVGMRVIIQESSQPASCGTYSYGETEDYIVEILPAPPCPSPSGLTAQISGTDSVSLSWTTGGATAWNFEWDTVGFTQGTGTRLSNLSSNTIGIGGLTFGGSYDFYVQDTCSGTGASNWIKITVSMTPCVSGAGYSGDTKLDSVMFAGRSFGSSASVCETYTARYSSADVINVTAGNSYNLQFINGSCGSHYGAYVSAWIDFNGDLEFDSTEQVYRMSSLTTGLQMTNLDTLVNIPITAASGLVPMRVIIRESSQPTACGTYSYGETEDYLLNIAQPALNDAGITAIVNDSICPSGDSLYAILKNFGIATLTGVTLNWEVSENSGAFVAAPTVAWSGSLAKDSSTVVALGMRNFNPINTYEIRAFTTNPNTVTDEDNSNDTSRVALHIRSTPTISFNLSAVCSGTAPFALNAAPAGGVWSGTGVYNNMFYPDTTSTGPGSYLVYYAISDQYGCDGFDSTTQRVDTIPVVSVAGQSSVCENGNSFALMSGMPLGGSFSGTAVVADTFRPALATVGMNTITYSFTDAHNCTASADTVVEVFAKPTVTSGSFPDICENAPAINLIGGTPTGGFYTGTGVSASFFVPSVAGAGTAAITYHYTDMNMCSDSADTVIIVLAAPVVSLTTFNAVCDNGGNITITGGTPAGGTYRGMYLSGTTFMVDSAGAGSYNITYRYSDSNNCSDSSTQALVVEASPVFSLGNDTAICGKQTLTLDPRLSGMQYLWSTGDTTQTIAVSSGATYSIKVSDPATANLCTNNDTVVVSYEATCVGISESLTSNADIRYYPNPNSGRFTLRAEGLEGMEVRLTILDGLGKVIKEIVFAPAGKVLEQVIDLGGVGAGVYYLHLHTEHGIATHMVTLRR
jgi:hypothetical protein